MKLPGLIAFYLIYLCVSLLKSPVQNIDKPYIKFLDVGQGDATLIVTKTGKKILIDGGPGNDIDWYFSSSSIIGECHIELMILTHDHADHSDGLERLLKHCKVDDYRKRLYAGDMITVDTTNLRVLWPPKDYDFTNTKDINDSSIVILLEDGDFSALLAGDVGGKVLCSLDYSKYLKGNLDVYKVSHHGSITGYCDKLPVSKETTSVIFVGKDNKFGLPDEPVLENLTAKQSTIRRTDEEGTIELKME
ncbi:MAG: hypothetical protein ACD_22C00031G0005 [uncultured bacterium]|nr:MAG: hypothetical protein ACD_22C00031G0005 [uncultured bacterium]